MRRVPTSEKRMPMNITLNPKMIDYLINLSKSENLSISVLIERAFLALLDREIACLESNLEQCAAEDMGYEIEEELEKLVQTRTLLG